MEFFLSEEAVLYQACQPFSYGQGIVEYTIRVDHGAEFHLFKSPADMLGKARTHHQQLVAVAQAIIPGGDVCLGAEFHRCFTKIYANVSIFEGNIVPLPNNLCLYG